MTDGDPHNLETRIQNTVEIIKTSDKISQHNKSLAVDFKKYLEGQGLSNSRISRYLYSLKTIMQEVFADNIARHYVESEEAMFDGNPLDEVRKHLKVFENFASKNKNEVERTVLYERPGGEGIYFRDPKDYRDYETITEEIRTKVKKEEEEELKEIIYNTWAERAHKKLVNGKSDIIWENVTAFLEEDIDEEEVRKLSFEDKYGDEVREVIGSNLNRILMGVISSFTSKAARSRLQNEMPISSSLDKFSTSNPAHLSSLLQTGELNSLRTDYNHEVGNYVGRVLHDLDVSHEDLEQNEEKLRELGRRSLDLALEMGKYEQEFYDEEDYREAVKFLARDIGLVE